MRWPRGLAAGLLATVLVAGAGLLDAWPAEATALPISQCTSSYGVVLAVDFGHWGGPVLRACGSTPTTGYTLLNQGGWHSAGTRTDGPGFVCRIGYSGYQGGADFPSESEQACYHTPPTTAYWSYWHADPGQSSWTYSQDGAQSTSPRPGSVDLWTFGGTGSSPRVSPDSVRAHNGSGGSPSSAPAPHSSAAPGGSPSASGAAGRGGPSAGPSGPGAGNRPAGGTSAPGPAGSTIGGSAGAEAGLDHAGPGPSARGTRTPTGTRAPASTTGAAPSAPAIVNAEPVPAGRRSAGSLLPGLVTAALVLALGATAAVVGRRRRQAR